jgi:tetratricopeptide (TPR) repeat protein
VKIAVYAIALNELHHIERFLESAADADVIVVADTGSDDGTVAALRAGGAVVHSISVRPWRFDDARNAALALIADDVDVCIPLDLDEVLAPGWRPQLEAQWGEATRGRYNYVWSHLADGRPGTTFSYDRIHARHGYRWVYPCHEALCADRIEERAVQLGLEVHHWPDPDKSRGGYLGLLEVAVAEQPDDPRMSHYLGREYMFADRHEAAVAELRRHVSLPRTVWRAERAASYRYIGRCLSRLGCPDEAVEAFGAATREHPESREPWIEFAQACHDSGRWRECYDACVRALAITEPTGEYMTEAWAWGERADDLAAVAAWHLGDDEAAIRHARAALDLAPHDDRIAANLVWFHEHPAVKPPN